MGQHECILLPSNEYPRMTFLEECQKYQEHCLSNSSLTNYVDYKPLNVSIQFVYDRKIVQEMLNFFNIKF